MAGVGVRQRQMLGQLGGELGWSGWRGPNLEQRWPGGTGGAAQEASPHPASGVSMKHCSGRKGCLCFLEKLLRKMLRGLMGLPENWFPPLCSHHWWQISPITSCTLGNFPTPLQEKNKEKTTSAGGNDSRVLLAAARGH